MKLKFLRLFLTMLIALVSTASYAYDAKIDGIYYNFSGSDVTVTYANQYSGDYSGDITVPSTVVYNGTTYSVTSIGSEAFKGYSGLTSIEIPNSITAIGNSAFEGCM